MTEEVVGVTQKFMIFLNTQWSIMANLFQASSLIHRRQADTSEYDHKLEKALSDVNEIMSLTVSTFNEIISEIGEYRDLSEDAFAFLEDDLQKSIDLSDQIAEAIKKGYTESVKAAMTILRDKLGEIGEKVRRHLKLEVEES